MTGVFENFLGFVRELPWEIQVLSAIILSLFLGMTAWAGFGLYRARRNMKTIVQTLEAVPPIDINRRDYGLSRGSRERLIRDLADHTTDPWWQAVQAAMVEYEVGPARSAGESSANNYLESGHSKHTGVFVTTPIDQLITPERLMGSPSWHRFYKLLPGVTTSLGLFGTFLALLLGLSGVQVTGATVTGTDVLINNLSGKFFTSVGAIALAVIGVIFEGIIARSLTVTFRTVVDAFDSRLPLLATGRVLVDIQVLAQSQAKSLSSINSDFALELGNLFRDSVAPAMAEQVTSSMAAELGAGLAPLLTDLSGSLGRLTETVNRLETSKQESVTGEIRAVVESLNSSMSTTLGAMGAQFREALGSSTQDEFSNLSRMLEGSTAALQGMTESFQSLQSGLHLVVENAQTATTKQMESGSEQVQRLQAMMESLVSGLSDSATQNVSAISTALSQAVAGLSSQMLELSDQVGAAVRSSSEESANASRHALNQAETWTRQTSAQLERVLESLQAKAALLDAAALRVTDSRAALEGGLKGVSSALDSLNIASTNIRGYTQDLVKAQSEALAGQEAQRQLAERSRELLTQVAGISRSHKELLEEQEKLLGSYQTAMRTLDADLARILGLVSGEMSKYSEAMQRNFAAVIEYGSKQIPEFTGTLKDGSAQLSEGLEELADAIDKATRRLGPGNA